MTLKQPKPSDKRNWHRLLRGVDYIERNIADNLTLAKVAQKAALSEHHFHRLFRARCGVPVIEYVRRRRLAGAATALLESKTSILHIALDAGFESQAAFSRAFRRVYLTSPARFRARGHAVPWLSATPITEATLSMFPGLCTRQPRLEVIDAFTIAGLADRFSGTGRERIPQLWSVLSDIVGHRCFGESDRIGISENDEATLGGALGYMAAIRLPPGQDVPEKLTSRTVPGGAYLVFDFAGPYSEIASAYDFIFGTWMPGSRYPLRPSPNFDRFVSQGHRLGRIGEARSVEIAIPVIAS